MQHADNLVMLPRVRQFPTVTPLARLLAAVALVALWALPANPQTGMTCAQLMGHLSATPASWGEVKQTQTEAESAPRLTVEAEGLLRLSPLKWPGGRQAAVSITYDGAFHHGRHLVPLVQSRGLRLDYEVVTYTHQTVPVLHASLGEMRALMEEGFHFFGHGHKHDLHDDFPESYVRESFDTCFQLMRQWGLNPRAYAYPGSAGTQAFVQAANRDAGFICARGDDRLDWGNYYIVPEEQMEPVNWYFLPSVVMGTTYASMVGSHDELRPILEQNLERGSWVILMYHAVGIPEGWGYYPLPEFERDLDWLVGNDVWVTHLDEGCAYIRQRAQVDIGVEPVEHIPGCRSYDVTLDDGLDPRVYDQALSFELLPPEDFAAANMIVVVTDEGVTVLDPAREPRYIDAVPDGRTVRIFLLEQSPVSSATHR